MSALAPTPTQYPIGYWMATGPGADLANANLIYNLADFLNKIAFGLAIYCLLYTSDAADDTPCVDLGGRRIIKNFSIEIRRNNNNAIFVGLQPGTVKSFLSKPFQENVNSQTLFTPNYSAKKLLKLIDSLDYEDSGKLFSWNGEEIQP